MDHMAVEHTRGTHSADGAALSFWRQSPYPLLMLVAQSTDDAAIGIEHLDDVG